ncbi:hypothetical protein HF521_019112 [Silurus meridionalis]|uniref:Chemokine interleukin-8-like domain-containing protein n=1 Tax=Silurus meridionalis TaxID=175797 RepID=A0A8T0BFH0_SILME|nr:hypothetical protein HF521_019112 [Silurus meridionalis]
MHFSLKMQNLAVVAFIVCVALAVASEKESPCCRQVSARKISVPITGFKIQQPRPPCVKAVIFFTANGAICSHWRENWVKEKVVELRKLQAIEKSKKVTTIASPTSEFPSTSL